jgi:hypothetical protein
MPATNSNTCPYKVGDTVRYTTSDRGYALDVMDETRLERGKVYPIERIEKEKYIVVEGYSHPGGGIYWTEFTLHFIGSSRNAVGR